MYFLDTNILLHTDEEFLNSLQSFYISNVTLEQLEEIKNSLSKDLNIKYRARQLLHWLLRNILKYKIIIYEDKIEDYYFSSVDSNDKKIIACAKYLQKQHQDIIFLTFDLNCFFLAKANGLKVEYPEYKNQIYNGYISIFCKDDLELADFYNNQLYNESFKQTLYVNQYILIYDKQHNLIDKYRYTKDNQIVPVPFSVTNSKMFGKVKPIDQYQELVLDSFKNNQLTLVKGKAGTGKSLLSMAYLFEQLEKGKIDRIIIFCNTVATAGSAKLGFYPGSRTEKLLDSQIGNFLISKIGAREEIERLIDQGQLLLLPMSDIRGFDTSGLKAGIYITEAQNLNVDLLKLALQRVGEDSICILDGDNETQVDSNLYAGQNNGLKKVSQVFKGQDFYGEITLKIIHRSKIAEIADLM